MSTGRAQNTDGGNFWLFAACCYARMEEAAALHNEAVARRWHGCHGSLHKKEVCLFSTMVKVIESKRPCVGIAGRRRRPAARRDEFIYYTATNGQTILEVDSPTTTTTTTTPPPQDASKVQSPLPSAAVGLNATTITPSLRKRKKRNEYRKGTDSKGKTTQRYDFMDMSDELNPLAAKTDVSVQVSVDEDDHKLSEKVDNNCFESVIDKIPATSDNEPVHDQQIEALKKQLQEKDKLIAKLLQSNGTSFSPPTSISQTELGGSKSAQEVLEELEVLTKIYKDEVAKLNIEVTKWKNEALKLSSELETLKCNSSIQRCSVYNVRYLCENTALSKSCDTQRQNQSLQQPTVPYNDKQATVAHHEPKLFQGQLPLQESQQQQQMECFDVQNKTSSRTLEGNNFIDSRIMQPLVPPKTVQNITYLGKPLFLQNHLATKAKFHVMVMSSTIDSEDDDDDR